MVVEKCNNREGVTQKLLSLFCEKVDECLKTKELVKFAVATGVVSLKRLLNHSILENWSSKLIKKSLETYFFISRTKLYFLKNNMKTFQHLISSVCKLRSNGMPVPLLRNGYSIFNGTKYR